VSGAGGHAFPSDLDRQIDRAVDLLRAGELVAFPTETVYGLGADAANDDALQRLYEVKGRPSTHPVIVHVASIDQLDDVAVNVSDAARALAHACWPGPLTIVVARRPGAVSTLATGGLETVGVRVPAHPVALEFLRRFGGGVAAPSANRFGRVSPTQAAHVWADLGTDVAMVLDGGPSRVGVESTIVDCTQGQPSVLRAGGVTAADITRVVGVGLGAPSSTRAPGTLAAHYAPHARVELVTAGELGTRVAEHRASGQIVGVLALAEVVDRASLPDDVVVLARPRDADAYAHDLYDALRNADAHGVEYVLAVAPLTDGIGAAVADRLRRASHQ